MVHAASVGLWTAVKLVVISTTPVKTKDLPKPSLQQIVQGQGMRDGKCMSAYLLYLSNGQMLALTDSFVLSVLTFHIHMPLYPIIARHMLD
jgi:hypothetical protein